MKLVQWCYKHVLELSHEAWSMLLHDARFAFRVCFFKKVGPIDRLHINFLP